MQLKSQYQELLKTNGKHEKASLDDGYVTDDVITSLLVYCIKAVLLRHLCHPDRNIQWKEKIAVSRSL